MPERIGAVVGTRGVGRLPWFTGGGTVPGTDGGNIGGAVKPVVGDGTKPGIGGRKPAVGGMKPWPGNGKCGGGTQKGGGSGGFTVVDCCGTLVVGSVGGRGTPALL